MSKITKVLSAKVPAEEYDKVQAEAERRGCKVSDQVRDILAEWGQYNKLIAELKTAIEGIVAEGNTDLTEALTVIVRAELRTYRDELKALKEETEAIKTGTIREMGHRLNVLRDTFLNPALTGIKESNGKALEAEATAQKTYDVLLKLVEGLAGRQQ